MIYNLNLGIGWASSGVEYAQLYRARMFRNVGLKAKFIFTDMFLRDNIEHMTENIGLYDEEVEWLYTFFTDTKISPVTFTLRQLEETFGGRPFEFSRDGKTAKYTFTGTGTYYTVYLVNETDNLVHRVEMVANGCLVRKDYYTYCRIFSEYYAPLDKKAHLYQRRFFNEDGSVCYEEITDNNEVMYKFPNRLFCSKMEFVGYMISCLNLTAEDTLILDRETGIGPSVLMNAGGARVISIVHADHFSEPMTDDKTILWNNYYEYVFAQNKHIDYYITATDAQNRLMCEQFRKYMNVEPQVVTIPVGSIAELNYPGKPRKPHSLITASRLATEKHIDWAVEAVVRAREVIPDLTFDIYGEGGTREELEKLIAERNAGEYIRLMGQQKLDEVYIGYEAYISGSMSEGFGLTLLEAVGSGLPIIGFDVRYGNPTFIDDGKNGYLIPVTDDMEGKEKVAELTDRVIRMFTEADLESFHNRSYEIGSEYLTSKIEQRWKKLLG